MGGNSLRSTIFVGSTLCLLAGAALAEESAIKIGDAIWQTAGASQDEVWKDFASLYETLDKTVSAGGTLKNRPATLGLACASSPSCKSQGVTSIAQDQGLYFGAAGIPKSLDVLLCRMNPKSCVVKDVPPSRLKEVGYDKEAKWTTDFSTPIFVPDLDFQQIIVNKLYKKQKGNRIDAAVVTDRQGCPSWEKSCENRVLNLNNGDPAILEPDFAGDIYLPTKAYRTEIPIFATQPVVTSVPVGDEPKISEIPKDSVWSSPKGLKNLVLPSPADLRSGEEVAAAAGSNSAVSLVTSGARAELLRLINYPSMILGKLRVPIEVLDEWIDEKHCAFDQAHVKVHNRSDHTYEIENAVCGTRSDGFQLYLDHGTHLLGIIAAREGAVGGAGIDPLSTIETDEIHPSKFSSETAELALAADRLNDLPGREASPRVVNLSWDYKPVPGSHDLIAEAISGLNRSALIVSAAGGDPGTENASKGACITFPSCLGLQNVLSVAAIDGNSTNPKIYSVSNWGDRIDVAAPGIGIVSSISGNRFSEMSGSSQAAAIVTGAVALFYRAYPLGVTPAQVRQRVIYTSDLFPDVKVFGGRINVGRFLDADVDTLVLHRNGNLETYYGDLDQNGIIYFVAAGLEQRTCAVRRLVASDGIVTMFSVRGSNDNGNYTCTGPAGSLRKDVGRLRQNGFKMIFRGTKTHPTADNPRNPALDEEIEFTPNELVDLVVGQK